MGVGTGGRGGVDRKDGSTIQDNVTCKISVGGDYAGIHILFFKKKNRIFIFHFFHNFSSMRQ